MVVGITSAQTLYTDPYPLEVTVGEEGNIDLVLDSSLPNGLKSYAIVLSVDDNVSITGITLPDWCQFTAVEERDYGWYVQCLDTNDEITEEDTNVTLATIDVSGVVAGSSDLFIQTVGSTPDGWVLGVYDDNNQPMFEDNVTIDDAVVVVIPDLTVVGIEVEGTPIVNEIATVDVTIANVGDGDAEGFNVSLYADGELVGVKTVESLVAGGEVTLEFEWTPSEAKTYELRAVVDPDNVIDESNETNNEMTVTVEVQSLPDLTVLDVEVEGTPIANEIATVNVTIANVGEGDAGEFNVSLYEKFDGEPIELVDVKTVDSLMAGEVKIVEFEWTPSEAGTYLLGAWVDSDNVVDESNETNNIMTVTVEVLEPANVFVEDFSVNVTEGIVPLVVEINATVVNTGDVPGEITVHFYIDGSEVYSETIEVAGGSVEYVTYIHTFTTPGTYNISVNNLPPKQVTVLSTTIVLTPSEGKVGTEVTVQGFGFSPNSVVVVWFVTDDEQIMVNTTTTDSNGEFVATFNVPDVPSGCYMVRAMDEYGVEAEQSFGVVPVPVEESLDEFGINLTLNSTAMRTDGAILLTVTVTNATKAQNTYVAVLNSSAWSEIEGMINEGTPITIDEIENNATDNWWAGGGLVKTISGLDAGEYYVIAYSTSSETCIADYVVAYNVTETVVVKPTYTPTTLEELGIVWDIYQGELNVSDVSYGDAVKIPINATQEVNLAILDSGTWNELYANISTLTKDDVFEGAKWSKENFKGNETLEVDTVSYGMTPGAYVIVVFNTTDSYIYCFNDSTTFNVMPVVTSVDWSELGIEEASINRTEMRYDETLRLVILRTESIPINIAVLNETTWDDIKKDKSVENDTIVANAYRIFGLTTDAIYYIGNLLPDKYVIVIYNVTSMGGVEYVNLYNDSLRFEVKLTPTKVDLEDLNVTITIDKATVDYGDSFNLTVNVTGVINVVIINESAWNELKVKNGLLNDTLIEYSKWSACINANNTWMLNTIDTFLPNNYFVVVYNTTTVSGLIYVNCYNDDVLFNVTTVANKVSFEDLGIVTMFLDKTEVVYGGVVKLTVDWNASVTEPVNIAILNETEWSEIISTTPTNESVINAAEWIVANVAYDLVENITANFKPDTYVVVAYKEKNGAITDYNDDLRFDVIFESKKVNLTDLVDSADVTPKEVTVGECVTIEVVHPKTNINVAIVDEETWNTLKSEKTISNDTLLSNAVWKVLNITQENFVETICTSGWNAGTYVIVIYNTSEFSEYVNWFNDGLTFNVIAPLKPAIFELSNLTVEPTEILVNETVNISVDVTNVGEVPGEFTAWVWLGGEGCTECHETVPVKHCILGSVEVEPQQTETISNTTHPIPWPGTFDIYVGNETAPIIGPVTIEVTKPPWQWYDENDNGKIEDQELINAIMDWLGGQITDEQLINVIMKWLEG